MFSIRAAKRGVGAKRITAERPGEIETERRPLEMPF